MGARNFTLYSRHATEVTLLIYGATDFVKPVIALELDPLRNKTGRIWHCFQPWMEDARYYAYQVGGPAGASCAAFRHRLLLFMCLFSVTGLLTSLRLKGELEECLAKLETMSVQANLNGFVTPGYRI